MFAQATRHLIRREGSTAARLNTARALSSGVDDLFSDYGKHVFTGAVADEYLAKQGASAELLNDPSWVTHSSDKVADAVFEWYVVEDVVHCVMRISLFCIWFVRILPTLLLISIYALIIHPSINQFSINYQQIN